MTTTNGDLAVAEGQQLPLWRIQPSRH